MTVRKILLFGLLLSGCIGCGGSQETILPTDELTPEQIAAIKAEDANVEDEESNSR